MQFNLALGKLYYLNIMKILAVLFLNIGMLVFAGCAGSSAEVTKNDVSKVNEIKQVSVEKTREATKDEKVQFIDVRTVDEYKGGYAEKAVNLPLDELESKLSELKKDQPVYVICQTGRRSQIASETLKENGFTDIYNVEGGTTAWEEAKLPLKK